MNLKSRLRQGVLSITPKELGKKGGISCFELQDWLDKFLAKDEEAALLPQPQFMSLLEEVMRDEGMVLDQGLVHYTAPEAFAKYKT